MNVNNAILHRVLGAMVVVLLIGVISVFVFDKSGIDKKRASLTQSISVNPSFDAGVLLEPENPTNRAVGITGKATDTTPPSAAQPTSQPIPKSYSQPAVTHQTPLTAPAQQTPQNTPQQTKSTQQKSVAGSGWSLRVGTFSDRQNARSLQASLHDEFPNVASRIKIVDGDSHKGKLYIVMLGPWPHKKEATRAQKIITQFYNIKPLVVKG